MFSGVRYDCGSKEGLLAATLARAASDPAYTHVFEGHPLVPAHAA